MVPVGDLETAFVGVADRVGLVLAVDENVALTICVAVGV